MNQQKVINQLTNLNDKLEKEVRELKKELKELKANPREIHHHHHNNVCTRNHYPKYDYYPNYPWTSPWVTFGGGGVTTGPSGIPATATFGTMSTTKADAPIQNLTFDKGVSLELSGDPISFTELKING